jgi:alkyl hydroperoxide reductase subunit F
MLDSSIIEQLKSVFAQIERDIDLVVTNSVHEKQAELLEMLQELSTTSGKIKVRSSDEQSPIPSFHIEVDGKANGISFVGIPGGHEFTSLILAILNSDGRGKFPDKMLQDRIRAIKGPVKLKTYISLSCENCPEVVQALNLMAIIHPEIEHIMIDGGLVQNEVKKLGILGVPSVVSNGRLLSSGKSNISDLISMLEKEFGKKEIIQNKEDLNLGNYDVVVVGAGPAGASAAIYSARKGLRTAIIADKIGGQVQETKGIENLISVKYTEGPHLAAQLAQHISAYDIKVLEHRRVKTVQPETQVKSIDLDSSESLKTKSLIVATGAKWRELDVPGEKEYLGRGVAYCPHCDGPYFKGKDVVVIGGGNSGVEAAIDLSVLVKSVTIIEYMPILKADQVLIEKLQSIPNIKVIKNARTHRVIGDGSKVIALEYEERSDQKIHQIAIDGIFVQIGLIPNSNFIKNTVETNKFGEIIIDEKCRTNIPGIYAAGDVTNIPYKQIIIAMGEGAKAGLASFEDIMLS